MADERYQPFYCEENVWWVLSEREPGYAVFITNAWRSVAIWSQRASERADGLIMWDYHVVAVVLADSQPSVIDPDCTAGRVLTLKQWVEASFPFAGAVPEDVEPAFRLVPAEDWFSDFRTDRSHMRDREGRWIQEPPPWPPLAESSNLEDYIDLRSGAPGTVLNLQELLDYW
jgi:hypothetical protein